MGRLIYSAIASADGYIEDAAGEFGWAEPDEELLRFVNDLERPIGTYLYGRRMYETMRYWETARELPGQTPAAQEFTGIWQAAGKIVFSTTLPTATTARSRRFPAASARLWSSWTLSRSPVAPSTCGTALSVGSVPGPRPFWKFPVFSPNGRGRLLPPE